MAVKELKGLITFFVFRSQCFSLSAILHILSKFLIGSLDFYTVHKKKGIFNFVLALIHQMGSQCASLSAFLHIFVKILYWITRFFILSRKR